MNKLFTPGPWEIHEWNRGDHSGVMSHGLKNGIWGYTADGVTQHAFQIVAGTEHLINSNTFGSFEGCHIAKIDIVFTKEGQQEAEANARLMSAAPDLREALVDLIQLIEVTFPKQQKVWLHQARAALEKSDMPAQSISEDSANE